MKYALNQPSWRRLWGRCELGECLVSESEADGDSARSSVAAVEEGAQRRPLQAVADGDSARGSVAAVEEGAQRRPLQAVVRELEAGWAKVGEGWSEVADLEGAGSGDASCREEVGRRGHMYIYTHISYNIYVHIDMGRSGGVGRASRSDTGYTDREGIGVVRGCRAGGRGAGGLSDSGIVWESDVGGDSSARWRGGRGGGGKRAWKSMRREQSEVQIESGEVLREVSGEGLASAGFPREILHHQAGTQAHDSCGPRSESEASTTGLKPLVIAGCRRGEVAAFWEDLQR